MFKQRVETYEQIDPKIMRKENENEKNYVLKTTTTKKKNEKIKLRWMRKYIF